MALNSKLYGRRTSVEMVFDHLYQEIVSMRLLPGTKISEAEIATMFDISRQPVRDAFSRLENLDLLLIRPQKATEVRGFSNTAITTARFVRLSVESEVLRRAARTCNQAGKAELQEHLDQQQKAVDSNDTDAFRNLDYDFHKELCAIGGVDYAFDVIAKEKAKVDRLCVLGLSRDDRLGQLLDDHTEIAEMISSNNEDGAVTAGVKHLSRLDATIKTIRDENSDFFVD